MRIFHNRPLSLACWLLSLTAVLSLSFSFGWKLAVLCLSLLGCVLSLLLPYIKHRKWAAVRRSLHIALCFLGVFLALLSHILFFHVRFERVQDTIGTSVEVEGIVIERTFSAAYAGQFTVEIDTVDGEREHFRAVLRTSYASALQSGDRVRMQVRVHEFEDEAEKRAYLSEGALAVFLCQTPEHCEIIGTAKYHPRVLFAKCRLALATRFCYAVGGEEGALGAALLLGEQSFLSKDTVLHFRRSGISHLLALSGLHVSILCGFAELFLRRICRLPRMARAIAIPMLLFGYLAITGCAPSTLRAVCMVLVLYMAFILRMEYDSFTALSVTLAGILVFSPYAVMDISMWLSFIAASSIVIFLAPISSLGERWGHKKSRPIQILVRLAVGLLTAICVGLTSNLALMWLLASVYGEVSLLSFPITLILSIPTSLLLILSIPMLLLPTFAPLGILLRIPAEWMLKCARWGSELRFGMLALSKTDALMILLLMFAVLILLAVRKIKRKAWFCLPLALTVIAVSWTVAQIKLSDTGVCMTYLQIGQGSICVFTENGIAVAVDATDGRAPHVKAIRSVMENERCTELSDLFFTRYYNMEVPYLRNIATTYRLRRLHLPTPLNDADHMIALRLEEEAALHGVEVVYGMGQTALSDLTLESYSYAPSSGSDREGILFTVACEGKRISMTNMSTRYSALMSEAQSRIAVSDILIVNSAGFTSQNNGIFEYRSERELLLLLEDEELLALMPPHGDEINSVADGECIRILLKES